ncbi:hypothetical protein X755_16060 [Mesorhizobium sp. LNJC405B00]|nr:hypothetical protein X755_16060 [Mesorhizobium sp. LNJC405B00]
MSRIFKRPKRNPFFCEHTIFWVLYVIQFLQTGHARCSTGAFQYGR